jgi:hypothetical protein
MVWIERLPEDGCDHVLYTDRDGNRCKDEVEKRYEEEVPDFGPELAECVCHDVPAYVYFGVPPIKSMKLSYVSG